jgi:hypothetical protein
MKRWLRNILDWLLLLLFLLALLASAYFAQLTRC